MEDPMVSAFRDIATLLALSYSLVGCIVSSWTILGCSFAIWGCSCVVCTEDLPSWLGRGPCGGGDDDGKKR